MLRKAFQSALLFSLLSLVACSGHARQSLNIASVKLSSDFQKTVHGVIPEYDGIVLGLVISTETENIRDVPVDSIWPGWIGVEIVNDKGVPVWKHTFTAADGYKVLRGRNLGMWELLPSPDRHGIKDPALRPVIPLEPGLEYSIRVEWGQLPSVPFEIKYSLEILQNAGS
jgi:hypothetical protein